MTNGTYSTDTNKRKYSTDTTNAFWATDTTNGFWATHRINGIFRENLKRAWTGGEPAARTFIVRFVRDIFIGLKSEEKEKQEEEKAS